MAVALIQTCVDERLNHELLRIQVGHKLAALHLKADRIIILNELGGNLGENFRNTAELMLESSNKIVLAAVLHHDDCRAAQAGWRRPLEETVANMAHFLAERQVNCVLAAGQIYTHNNHIIWLEDQRIKPG